MLPPRWAHAAMPTADGQLIICGGANGPISYGEIVSLAVDLLVAKVQYSVFVVMSVRFIFFAGFYGKDDVGKRGECRSAAGPSCFFARLANDDSSFEH